MKAIHEKAINEKFAQQHSISIDEMNIKAQENFDALPDIDPVTGEELSEDAKWGRAYRQTRRAFSKKVKTMANAVDGMIVCRMPNIDFNRNQYNFALRQMEKDGKEVAMQGGFVDENGNPLYTWGNQKGEIIVDDDGNPGRPSVNGRAIAYIFKKNDKGEYKNIEPRYMFINRTKADDNIPVCQLSRFAISVADKKQDGFFADTNYIYYNDATLSADSHAPYNFDEVQEILGQWNRAFGEHFTVISSKDELTSFKEEHTYSKDNKKTEYDFCVIPGNVMGVSPGTQKWNNAEVSVEFIDYDTLESSIISIYIPPEFIPGLDIHDDDKGIFVLQSVQYGEKQRWHLGGFLHVADDVDVEAFFGVSLGDGEEDV